MNTKILLPLIAMLLLSSCSSKMGIMKRHYTKGFYVSSSHSHESKRTVLPQNKPQLKNEVVSIQRIEPQAHSETVNKPAITAENSVMSSQNISNRKSFNHKKSVQTAIKTIRSFKPIPSMQHEQVNLNTGTGAKGSDEEILLIILCILLPPLAVYLFENKIGINFWVDLILTLLFWFPGMIFAFLVCFAGVSLG
jgi:uncharacterized membrane protein YqaE (UPF0057 family)